MVHRPLGLSTRHYLVPPVTLVCPAVSIGPAEQQPQDEDESPRRGSYLPFFAALVRVQQVRHECSKLVGSKHQSAGFELLEVRHSDTGRGWRVRA
jgi:hypothetical protein